MEIKLYVKPASMRGYLDLVAKQNFLVSKAFYHYWFCRKAISDANCAKATFSLYIRDDVLTCSKIGSVLNLLRYQNKKVPKYSIF